MFLLNMEFILNKKNMNVFKCIIISLLIFTSCKEQEIMSCTNVKNIKLFTLHESNINFPISATENYIRANYFGEINNAQRIHEIVLQIKNLKKCDNQVTSKGSLISIIEMNCSSKRYQIVYDKYNMWVENTCYEISEQLLDQTIRSTPDNNSNLTGIWDAKANNGKGLLDSK